MQWRIGVARGFIPRLTRATVLPTTRDRRYGMGIARMATK